MILSFKKFNLLLYLSLKVGVGPTFHEFSALKTKMAL